MSKWWALITIAVSGAVAAIAPTVQGDVAKHPELSMILASVVAIVGHLLPSPTAK